MNVAAIDNSLKLLLEKPEKLVFIILAGTSVAYLSLIPNFETIGRIFVGVGIFMMPVAIMVIIAYMRRFFNSIKNCIVGTAVLLALFKCFWVNLDSLVAAVVYLGIIQASFLPVAFFLRIETAVLLAYMDIMVTFCVGALVTLVPLVAINANLGKANYEGIGQFVLLFTIPVAVVCILIWIRQLSEPPLRPRIREDLRPRIRQDVLLGSCIICFMGTNDNSPIEMISSCCGQVYHIDCYIRYCRRARRNRTCPSCHNALPRID